MLLRSIITLVIIFLSFVVVDVFRSICMVAVFITLFLGWLVLNLVILERRSVRAVVVMIVLIRRPGSESFHKFIAWE